MIAKYGYNMEKAQQVVDERMTALGATKGADGKWEYKGKPVVIVGLIRTEDLRKEIGDYFANQLEKLGFTVQRDYKVRAEASPIWNNASWDPCAFNYYTAGWIQTAIARDSGGNFAGYNDAMAGWSDGFVNYNASPEYKDALTKLFTNAFNSMEERDAIFNAAIPLSMAESWHGAMVVDINSFQPRTKDISVASDLVAGSSGSVFWPYTIMKEGGGTVKIAQSGVMVEPWNPVSASNWIDDTMPARATIDWGAMNDPYTGLYLPQRIESGSLQAVTGTPIVKTLDWVGLEFVDEIKVPGECWADWDAVNQKWITVAEKYPEGLTSKTAVTVNYPSSLYDTKWHDGSSFSAADIVEHMILTFDLGKPESKNFNVDYQPGLDAYLTHFKGICITSTDPLTIVTYDDAFNLDAENTVAGSTWYPADATSGSVYQYGTAGWHNLVPALLAEQDGKINLSKTTAAEKSVEWTSLLAGPSLEIQKQYLDKAAAEKYIPYANVLGQYVTADEAAARYANLQKFYADRGHLWVGTGPFYVDAAFPVEGTLVLKRFADYADPLDRWSGFAEPRIAVASVDGPATVTIGEAATFNVTITFNDAPYPQADLNSVSYIVKDATGAIALSGDATITGDGAAVIELTADQTSKLVAGSNVLTVAVSSKVVALPTFAPYEFVTVAP